MSHDASSQASGVDGLSVNTSSVGEKHNARISALPARPLTPDELDNVAGVETISMLCGIHKLSQLSPPGYISLGARTRSDAALDLCAFNPQTRQWEKVHSIESEQTLSAAGSIESLSRRFERTIDRSYQARVVEHDPYAATIDIAVAAADLLPLFPNGEATPQWVQRLASLPAVASVIPTHERVAGGIVGLVIAVYTMTETPRLYGAYYRPRESGWTIPLHMTPDLSSDMIADALHRIGVNLSYQLERRYREYTKSDVDRGRSLTTDIYGHGDFPDVEF